MTCRRYEKWMSDEIDGALSREKTGRLRRHLAECAACRAYQQSVLGLQRGTGCLPRPEIGPDYWPDFMLRLESRTRAAASRPVGPRPVFKRWAWSGAGAGLILALALSLLLSRTESGAGDFFFSFEEALDSLSERIGENAEVEELFNALIQNSIDDHESGSAPHFSEEPLIWENLSDEELSAIETALKKRFTS